MRRGRDISRVRRSSSTGQETDEDQALTPEEELAVTLDHINTSGEFSSKTTYSQFANPGIQIDDTLIALPLDPNQVTLIRDASRQAPFGRGDKTLIDTSVRNTWELDSSKFRITNPAWDTFLGTVVKHVSKNLGMSDIRPDLYKLLLYEKGSFFKCHKDSEKAPGMIATLSICLPSKYEGGEVHLSHAGKKVVFDTAGESIFDASALAWYADVTHEIKPITEGNRLVLIYNIIRTGAGPKSAGFLSQQYDDVCSALARLSEGSGPPPTRLIYLLEHKYSKTSLQINQLKGRDRAIAHVLKEACARNGYYLFLCNLTKVVEDGNEEWSEDGDESSQLAMDTVTTCDGQVFATNVDFDMEQILGNAVYEDRLADSQSEGDDTGNEGATIEYRYHDSAVMIIPKGEMDQFVEFDANWGAFLDVVMDDLNSHPEDSTARQEAIDLLSAVVERHRYLSSHVLKIAMEIKNAELYDDAVTAGFANGVPSITIVDALVDHAKQTPPGTFDWDKSFGAFVTAHLTLKQLSVSLDTIERNLDPGDMRTYFKRWRAGTEFSEFERRHIFGPDDHEAIIHFMALHCDDENWIKSTLVPKVRDSGSKILLSKFIRALLEKAKQDSLKGALDTANLLLESSVQKLNLAKVDLSLIISQDPAAVWSNDTAYQEIETFCQLVDNCLSSGLEQHANELLRLSLGTVKTSRKPESYTPTTSLGYGTAAQKILNSICSSFEKSGAPPSEPAQAFVTAVLKKYVIRDLPRCPKPLPGHRHQARGCGKCKHCQELDEFLHSTTEEVGHFFKGPRLALHMQGQLPAADVFACAMTEVRTKTNNNKPQQFRLTVRKLGTEHRLALDAYMHGLRHAARRLRPYRTAFMEGFLGETAYADLVLLRQQPHAETIEVGSGPVESAPVGQKRQAQADLELPLAKR